MKKLIITITSIVLFTSCFRSDYEVYNDYVIDWEQNIKNSIRTDKIVLINSSNELKNTTTTYINKRSYFNSETNELNRYLEFFKQDSLGVIQYKKIMLQDVNIVINDTIKQPLYKHSKGYRYTPTLYISNTHLSEDTSDFKLKLE